MSALVIVDIEITDPTRYEEYKRLAAPTVGEFGGRYVVRGGDYETLEGDWTPKRVVVLEFESVVRAKEWWASESYAPAKALRQQTANTNMVVVDEGPVPGSI